MMMRYLFTVKLLRCCCLFNYSLSVGFLRFTLVIIIRHSIRQFMVYRVNVLVECFMKEVSLNLRGQQFVIRFRATRNDFKVPLVPSVKKFDWCPVASPVDQPSFVIYATLKNIKQVYLLKVCKNKNIYSLRPVRRVNQVYKEFIHVYASSNVPTKSVTI